MRPAGLPAGIHSSERLPKELLTLRPRKVSELSLLLILVTSLLTSTARTTAIVERGAFQSALDPSFRPRYGTNIVSNDHAGSTILAPQTITTTTATSQSQPRPGTHPGQISTTAIARTTARAITTTQTTNGPSYIIFVDPVDPGMIKAKNGITGKIDFSGTDAAAVIQKTLDSLKNGGQILLAGGTYPISSTIQIRSENTVFSGTGKGTVLRMINGANLDFLLRIAANFATVSDLTIDSNEATQRREDRTGWWPTEMVARPTVSFLSRISGLQRFLRSP